MPKFILLLCACVAQLYAFALSKATADSAYMRGDYPQAIAHYDALLASGPNATLYHNQGNAYYRLKQYPQAILAYERGLRYAPADSELAHNLALAQSKLPAVQRSASPFFFVIWYQQALLALTVFQWACVAGVALLLALALLFLYLLARAVAWRKVGFFGCCVATLGFLWAVWSTFALRSYLATHTTAIVMARTPMADSPSTHATATAYVEAGTKVEVTDRSLGRYWRVSLPDGKHVWVQQRDLAEI